MASSIFFNGRVISVPGSYSEVDASGLDTVGLGATGIVAVLATGEGGRPVSDITEASDLPRYTSAEKMRRAFRAGDLREVGNMLFAPAKDPDILAGAQEVVVCKVNPATKSTAVLQQSGSDAIDLESLDYGAFTAQINVQLAGGTTQGKQITIIFEDVTEAGDDIGGDTLATLLYTPGSFGWGTMVGTIDTAGNVTADATKTVPGEADKIDNPVGNNAIEILSSNAGDNFDVTVFGLVSGVITMETLTLNGTSVVTGSTTFDAGEVKGVFINGTTAGIVTVRNIGAGLDVFTVPAGVQAEGVRKVENGFVNAAAIGLVLDAAGTPNVWVVGRNAAGSQLKEIVAMTGTTPTATAGTTYSFLDWLVTGNVAAGVNLVASAEAAQSTAAVQTNIQKAADFWNSKQNLAGTEGFFWTTSTGNVRLTMDNLDPQATINMVGPATLNMTADLYALVQWINANSQLISAAVSTGSPGVPDNTPAPVFLSGGSEGTANFTQYQNALNLLKGLRVNSIVDLSGDPAVAAALDSHCAYMGGIGRSERDGFVGIVATTMGVPDVPAAVATKNAVKQAVVDLNTRHIRAFSQFIDRYNTDGEIERYPSPFLGAIAAGMQAGSPVGTSLTFKFANVLAFTQDSTWNPVDDAEEMIQAGAMFLENVEGVGRRFVRNITTHLTDNNIAFTEGSVNEAVNVSVFNLRTNLEFIVGKKGFSGTIGSTRSAAVNTLGLLVDALTIVGYRNLDVELVTDVMDVSVDLAAVIPINFVRTTVHLVTLQQLAAQ